MTKNIKSQQKGSHQIKKFLHSKTKQNKQARVKRQPIDGKFFFFLPAVEGKYLEYPKNQENKIRPPQMKDPVKTGQLK